MSNGHHPVVPPPPPPNVNVNVNMNMIQTPQPITPLQKLAKANEVGAGQTLPFFLILIIARKRGFSLVRLFFFVDGLCLAK